MSDQSVDHEGKESCGAQPVKTGVSQGRVQSFPASSAQRRMWTLEQVTGSAGTVYTMPGAVLLTGSLDVTLMARALADVVKRHESLRTTFRLLDSQVRQLVHADVVIPLTEIDLSGDADPESTARRYAHQDFATPFDLERGPLLRARLLRLGRERRLLLFNIHHSVCDAWSLSIIFGEWLAFYAAHRQGNPVGLTPLRIQYKEYASWQNTRLAGPAGDADRDYWRKQLAGYSLSGGVPADFVRPVVQTFRGDKVGVRLEEGLVLGLRRLGRVHGTGLFVVCAALLKVLLFRYHGEPDGVIGTPVSGRAHADLEHQVGLYVNTLVLRDTIDGNVGFAAILAGVRQTVEEALEHQGYPFDMLLEQLDLRRDTSRNPLFDVMLAYDVAREEVGSLGDVTLSPYDIFPPQARFDLTWHFLDGRDSLTVEVVYNIDLFLRERVEQMVGHLRQLALGVLADPDLPVARVVFMTPAEIHQLRFVWNTPPVVVPQVPTVMDMIEAQAAQHPERLAVGMGAKHLSYAALNRQANQLAHVLRERGVAPGDRVGVLLARSCEWIVSLLGVLKIGAVYVAMDPATPPARSFFILREAGSVLLLTEDFSPEWQSLVQTPVFDLKLEEKGLDDRCADNPPREIGGGHPAYVVFTSGSTGEPKGVVNHHSGLTNMVNWHNVFYQMTPEDRCSQLANPAFDATVAEIWPILAAGASLWVMPEDVRDSLLGMMSWFSENKITCGYIPTPLLAAMMDLRWTVSLSLRVVWTGGDALHRRPPSHWPFRVANNYGPSEHTVVATAGWVDPSGEGVPTIGRPIANTVCHVVDDHLQLVPVGIPGELLIGGPNLALGYVNRPDLTDALFIADPWDPAGGGRVYRTGDRVRLRFDGNLEFLGRRDGQVKIRGQRVELGEIQAVLLADPQLDDALVLVREAPAGGREIVAFVIGRGDSLSLRDRLVQVLPDFMIPSRLVFVAAFPLTANGKVDREALLLQAAAEWDVTKTPPIAARSALEEKLVRIWETVLGIEGIGVEGQFFDLGGHSLAAIQVITAMERELGVKIGLKDLFGNPTVARLAQEVARRKPVVFQPIEPVAEAPDYPASRSQFRLWVLEKLGVDRSVYLLPEALLLEGPLDRAALARALELLVGRHASLRTTFFAVDDQLRQRVAPPAPLAWAVEDYSGFDNPDQRVAEEVARQAVLPFDLERGPLFRVVLYRLGEDRHLLFFTMHHNISDGWSRGVFGRELLILYMDCLAGRKPSLQPLRIHYPDYAVWQQRLLAGPEGRHALEYWLQRFADLPQPLDLPTDHPRPHVPTFHGDSLHFILDETCAGGLRQLAKQSGATLFMALLSLVKVVLHRTTGQEQIVVGMPVAGRDHPDLVEQIGFFVNMLPLVDHVSGNESFLALLGQVRRTVTEALDHAFYPFDLLVEALPLQREMSRSPLFDVVVSMEEKAPVAHVDLPVMVTPQPLSVHRSKFDLTFFFSDRQDGRIAVGLEYATDLFGRGRMERMVGHLGQLARAVVSSPDVPVANLAMLTPAEQSQLLDHFSGVVTPYPKGESISAVFAGIVARFAELHAVRFGDVTLTYRELDDLSGRLAGLLGQHRPLSGSSPGIAVFLEPSHWVAVALLGILKAGGAYVPIDPGYPQARVDFILKDASCVLAVTSARHLDRLPGGVVPVLVESIPSAPPFQPKLSGDGNVLAYVMYTSGSTGKPKGSLIEQKSVLRLVLNTNYITLGPEDRILQAGSLAFDASTFEIWGMLLNGGCVVWPQGREMLDSAALQRLIRDHQITVMWLTASLFNQHVDANIEVFQGLRSLLIGGEKLSVHHVNRVVDRYPRLTLINGYGPTENTTFSLCMPIKTRMVRDVPLGRPIANSSVYILDGQLQLLPVGVIGEICLSGDGVARGYLNRPELTERAFPPNPWVAGQRLYRTRDRGRWTEEGVVEFFGRMDQQVKVRGFRVEPGEIEIHLLSHPMVREAVVIPRAVAAGILELVAYVTGADGLTWEQLRVFLGEIVPGYMIPARIVVVERLPLTQNGKVDRQALATLEQSLGEVSSAGEPPLGAEEEVLARVWQEVLGRTGVGRHDRYFELGGDSIRAIQIVSRLRREGWQVSVQELFLYPTIASLAVRMCRRDDVGEVVSVTPGPVPLTAVQRWFFQTHPGCSDHFNQSVWLQCTQPVNPQLLQQALQVLLVRNDALNLTYQKPESADGSNLGEVIQSNSGRIGVIGLPIVTLDSDSALESLINRVHRQFDLTKGPLLQATLVRLPQGERLLLVAHHLAVDGVSWRILMEELETAYQSLVSGVPVDLGPGTSTFAAWSNAITRYAASPELLAELDYWRALVQGVPVPAWMVPVEKNTYGDAREEGMRLTGGETTPLLGHLHRAYTTETYDLLLAALSLALCAWSGDEDTLITLEGHGREPLGGGTPDVSRTVGWFTSLFPFRLRIPKGTAPGLRIKMVKESLRHLPKRGVGYGILRTLTPEEHRLEGSVSPWLSFNYLGHFATGGPGQFVLGDGPMGMPIDPAMPRPHAVDVTCLITAGQLHVSVLYHPGMIPGDKIKQLLNEFRSALGVLTAHCLARTTSEKTPSDFTECWFSLEGYAAFLQSCALQPDAVEDIYGLTPMQEGLWLESHIHPDSEAYFIQVDLGWSGVLRRDAFIAAWREMALRHAIFRTTIIQDAESGRLVQVVCKQRELPIVWDDGRGLSSDTEVEYLQELKREDRLRGFDLAAGSLFRVRVVRLAETRWRVIWSYHHIALDGWCMGVVYREWQALYHGYLTGNPPRLPVAPPYSAVIRWLESRNHEDARAFWRGYLEGYDRSVSLPPAWRKKIIATGIPGEHLLVLPEPLSDRLRELAARSGTTLNTVIQAVWAILLGRYNREGDVVFGVVVSGRPPDLSGVEGTVGLFINTIPVRANLAPARSFVELLTDLQGKALAATAHDHLSLAQIQGESPLGRDLFDHVLAFENYPLEEALAGADTGGDTFTITDVAAHDRTHYGFDLTIFPAAAIQIKWSYDAGLYDEVAMVRMATHWQTLLDGVVANPSARLDSFKVLGASEQERVVGFGQGPRVDYPVDQGISALFERQVALGPDRIACRHNGVGITYEILNKRVNQLGRLLREMGVVGGFVGILENRGVNFLVAMLGILKSGAAFVPMDLAYPEERLVHMLTDCGFSIVIACNDFYSNDSLKKTLHNVRGVVYLDDLPESDDSPVFAGSGPTDGAALDGGPKGRDVAYMLYTSGSTGVPKGAMVRHDGAINHIFAEVSALRLDRTTVFLQSAPASSDISVWQFLAPVLIGGRVVVADYPTMCDPGALWGLLGREGVTLMELTPGVMQELLNYVAALPAAARKLPTLALAMVTGEAVLPALIRHWFEVFPGVALVNAYGPTEAADDVCQYELNVPLPVDSLRVPIGRPLANMDLFVVDPGMTLMPIGVVGEIGVAGIGVGVGYWNNPEQTAASFIQNPYCRGTDTTILYRTGDLGFWREDGQLEFVGRIDAQVKIRGFRIELGEIEAVMERHPGVERAVVTLWEPFPGDRRLVGHLVGKGGVCVTTAEMRAFLKPVLPAHMVPFCILSHPSLPLSPSGKVDRKRLPVPAGDETGAEKVELLDRLERRVARIWEEVLQVRGVGRGDEFFALGGHSLKAMQLVSRLQKELDAAISIGDLFAHTGFADLCAVIRSRATAVLETIPVAAMADHYPLSYAQKRIWLVEQHEGVGAAYNMPEALLFTGVLDGAALERALAGVIHRHEGLRTCFISVDGEPRQKVFAEIHVPLQRVDLAGVEDPFARARDVVEQDAHLPFALDRLPLLRTTWIRLGERQHVFLVTMHHIIGDGWSQTLFFQELLTRYAAEKDNRPVLLNPLRIQYKDFSAWQNQKSFDREKSYWLSRMVGVPSELRLPYDFTGQGEGIFAGGLEEITLTGPLLAGLQAKAKDYQTTLSNVIFALFNLFIYNLSHQDDICIGLSSANRDHPDFENIMGFFVNLLPIRTRIEEEMDFDQLLRQVITNVNGALDHQGYPFDLLVAALNPQRRNNRQPIVNVVYTFQNYLDVAMDIGLREETPLAVPEMGDDGTIRPFPWSFRTAKFDLTLFTTLDEGRLQLAMEYDKILFKQETIRGYLVEMEQFANMIIVY